MYSFLLALVIAQATPTAVPALTVSPTSVNLNPAQQQVIAVTGATPPLQLTLDQKLVVVTADPNGTSLTIAATQQTGTDVLHVSDANGASADIAIRVAFNAGTIVPQTTLTITGDPAQPDWLAQEVTDWVTRLTQAMPGAQITMGTVSPPPAAPLGPGGTAQFTVSIQISGNGQYFDQSGTTTVTVQNTALPPFLPGLLFTMTIRSTSHKTASSFAGPSRPQRRHASTTITTISPIREGL